MLNFIKTFIFTLLVGSILIKSQTINNINNIDNDELQIITLQPNNFIAISDEIKESNFEKWSMDLSKIDSDTNKIYVYIDSIGGSVEVGNKLINQFNYYSKIGKSIECIAKNAFSMAFQIFQNCDKRYILSSSVIMQHQVSLQNIKGPLINTMNYLKMIQSMSDDLDKKSAKKINIPYDEYKKLIQNDWWLYGQDIISNGVADSMVIIGCDPKLFNIFINQTIGEIEMLDDGSITLNDINVLKHSCPL